MSIIILHELLPHCKNCLQSYNAELDVNRKQPSPLQSYILCISISFSVKPNHATQEARA